MLQELAQALSRQDYQTARELLRILITEDPDNPWVRFYLAQLCESQAKTEEADKIYRELLINSSNPQILSKARQGIARISDNKQKKQQESLQAARKTSGELAALVLKPVHPEMKNKLAQAFAEIFSLDIYSARLRLPTRAWRLYRTGALGEIQLYYKKLQEVEIPCFVLPIETLTKIKVYQVQYLSATTPKAIAVCKNPQDEIETISFNWEQVKNRVTGRLPLLTNYEEKNFRGKLEFKTKTTDYFTIFDLHLSDKQIIVRFCEYNYDFANSFNSQGKNSQLSQTSQENWRQLKKQLEEKTKSSEDWGDFDYFATNALDFPAILAQLPLKMQLLREKDTPLDAAFELYSRLVFYQNILEGKY